MPLDATISTSAWSYIHGHISGTDRNKVFSIKFSCIWNGSGVLYNASYLDLYGSISTFQIATNENYKPYLIVKFARQVKEVQTFAYWLANSGTHNIATEFSTAVPAETLISNGFVKSAIDSDISGNAATATAANITSTDSAVVRYDGTAGKFQNSKVLIDDSGGITSASGVVVGAGYLTIKPYSPTYDSTSSNAGIRFYFNHDRSGYNALSLTQSESRKTRKTLMR